MRVLLVTEDDTVVGRAMCDQFQAEQLEAELTAGVAIRNRQDQTVTKWQLVDAPSWEIDHDQAIGRRLTVEAVPGA